MTALPCVPDCRGVDLSNTTLTGVNLNGVNLVNANSATPRSRACPWSARISATMARTYLGSAILNGATMVDSPGLRRSGRLPGCYLG